MPDSELDLEIAREKARKQPSDQWKRGPKITKEDLLDAAGTGEIDIADINQDLSKPNTLGFGKYKDKTFEWVYQNDRRYFFWAGENIRGFDDRAKAALKQ